MLLSGRVALVTGATGGIGFHTALGLARLGAVVYVTGRDARRGEEAERRLRGAAGHDGVHFIRADASTIGGNQELAQHIRSQTEGLHILVNNVGGSYNDRWVTEDGYEATLAMNFLGPFALTGALLRLLRRSAPARVVTVSSAAIGMWKGDPFDDVHAERSYLASDAYARSKLFNVLWTFALARRLAATGIVANALHPGLAWTSMTAAIEPRGMPSWMRHVWPLMRWLQRRGSAEKAARTGLFLASAPEGASVTGKYFGSNRRPARTPPAALDSVTQERTWALAERLIAAAPTARTSREVVA